MQFEHDILAEIEEDKPHYNTLSTIIRNLEEKVRGKLSKKYLTDLLKSSKKLVVKTHKGSETGKFGRILGELFGNGVNLNLKMCNDGYAVQYYGQNKSLVEAQHMKNKKKLIKKGILKA